MGYKKTSCSIYTSLSFISVVEITIILTHSQQRCKNVYEKQRIRVQNVMRKKVASVTLGFQTRAIWASPFILRTIMAFRSCSR